MTRAAVRQAAMPNAIVPSTLLNLSGGGTNLANFGLLGADLTSAKYALGAGKFPFMAGYAEPTPPVTAGLRDFETDDELYTCLEGAAPIQVLATATSKVDRQEYPMAFVLTPGKGRTFHCVLGHDAKALGFPAVGQLFRRGTAWATGLAPAP